MTGPFDPSFQGGPTSQPLTPPSHQGLPASTGSGSQRFRSGSQRFPGEELPAGSAFPLAAGFARVERVLGRGGMGVVYLVRDDRLGRRAALKLTRGQPSPRRTLRFQREVRVTAGLDHPNIPPVYEAGRTHDGQDYLLLRYVDGEPLSELLETLHKDAEAWATGAAPRQLVGVLLKVCEAVAYAHRQGVIHRDLKPDNVMVGAFGEVLVMDWGLARILSEDAAIDRQLRDDLGFVDPREGLTMQGAVLGTPGFMPPEQARGVDVDARADVFSLGAILCMALTGQLPFVGAEDGLQILYRTLDGAVGLPAEAELAPELRAICERAVAPEPADRYPAATELAEDLRAWLEGRPVSVYAYRPLEQAARLVRANPALFSAIGVAFLGLFVAAGLMVWTRSSTIDEVRVGDLAAAREAAASAWEASQAAPADLPLDERVGLALSALQAAQRWRTLAGDDEAAAAQYRAAVGLSELAQAGEQWALARQALSQAAGLGVSAAQVEVLLRQLDEAETRELERRREAVRGILDAVGRGAFRDRTTGPTDAVFQLLRYPGPATRTLLLERLDALVELLRSSELAAYMEVAEPSEVEAQQGGGALAGLDDAWRRRAAGGELTPAQRALLAEAEQRLVTRRSPHAGVSLGKDTDAMLTGGIMSLSLEQLLADAQTLAASLGQLDELEVLCRALGRLEAAPESVAGLDRYLRAERALVRAAVGLRSVCELGGDEAAPVILRALERWGGDAGFVDRVGSRLGAALARVDLRGAPALARRAAIEALERGGDLDAALLEAERLLGDAPQDVSALELRARLLVARKRHEAALETLAKALELAPGEARLWTARAAALVAQGQAAEAESAAAQALELSPELPEGWLRRAQARLASNQLDLAEQDLQQALQRDPRHVASLIEHARLLSRRGRHDDAAREAERACDLEPWSLEPWLVLSRALTFRRDLPGALRALSRALEIDPHSVEALADRAALRALLGEPQAGLLDARRALELAPGSALAWVGLGFAEHVAGRTEQALEALSRAIEVDAQCGEAWALRGELRLLRGEVEAAEADLERAVSAAPGLAMAWNSRGMLEINRQRYKEAIAELDQAIELDPFLAEAYSNRGMARYQLKQFARARGDMERAVELQPQLALGWSNLGQTLAELEDYPAARQALERAVALDPQFGMAWFNLGSLLLGHGDHEAARAALESAARVSAGIARTWSSLAEADLLCGDPARALEHLDEAKRRGQSRTIDIYVRGAALGLTGKLRQGLNHLERYLKQAPQGEYAKQARDYQRRFQAELDARKGKGKGEEEGE